MAVGKAILGKRAISGIWYMVGTGPATGGGQLDWVWGVPAGWAILPLGISWKVTMGGKGSRGVVMCFPSGGLLWGAMPGCVPSAGARTIPNISLYWVSFTSMRLIQSAGTVTGWSLLKLPALPLPGGTMWWWDSSWLTEGSTVLAPWAKGCISCRLEKDSACCAWTGAGGAAVASMGLGEACKIPGDVIIGEDVVSETYVWGDSKESTGDKVTELSDSWPLSLRDFFLLLPLASLASLARLGRLVGMVLLVLGRLGFLPIGVCFRLRKDLLGPQITGERAEVSTVPGGLGVTLYSSRRRTMSWCMRSRATSRGRRSMWSVMSRLAKWSNRILAAS